MKISKTLLAFLIICEIFSVACKKNREYRETKYENGQVKEEYYVIKNSDTSYQYDGKYKMYYKNGQKKEEGTYVEGKPDGVYTWWYKNGQKKEEGTYVAGKRNGVFTVWYENGNLRSKTHYKNDTINGEYIDWYKNGQKRKKGTYVAGKADGVYTWWYENGQKKQEAHYDNGVLHGVKKQWSKNGGIKSEKKYVDGYLEKEYIRKINSKCIDWKYRDFYANKIDMGEIIKLKGKIINVTKNGANIATGSNLFLGYIDDEFWIEYNKDEFTLIDDDIVTLWGYYNGLATMKSGLNEDIKFERPEIEVIYLINHNESLVGIKNA